MDRPAAARLSRRSALVKTLTGAAVLTAIAPDAHAQDSPELEAAKSLLKAHDDALKNQDINTLLGTFAKKCAMIGSGPGEIWSGSEEIKSAYENIFKGFDKGSQDYDYHFRLGGLQSDAGWLVTSGNIKGKKDGKEFEFPINLSLTVVKEDGAWKIAALHFSTLTGPEKQ